MNASIELYLTVVFYLTLIGLILKLGIIGLSTYPRRQEYSLGFDISLVIVQLCFFVWIIYLKWFSI